MLEPFDATVLGPPAPPRASWWQGPGTEAFLCTGSPVLGRPPLSGLLACTSSVVVPPARLGTPSPQETTPAFVNQPHVPTCFSNAGEPSQHLQEEREMQRVGGRRGDAELSG